jgi:hypothetical protein
MRPLAATIARVRLRILVLPNCAPSFATVKLYAGSSLTVVMGVTVAPVLEITVCCFQELEAQKMQPTVIICANTNVPLISSMQLGLIKTVLPLSPA